ncbi:hypothetical protein [Actinoplanes teichomyceticus]|uniref:ABC-2 type transport system permease protein n=1 Tax=Actinoplanes teichomyceticus TaxID=1867 RepID=A0A561VSR9_ACTTI|nr:hypothetical protein [Actinoplanes teichomyceticus]TWG14672.1 hypothetical protein FHX34_104978 [Actinoplanes teichomyceticus]GIF10075.1 hypothetical protein Ate01nite_01070 [Actinoplanes teichomyceticus]
MIGVLRSEIHRSLTVRSSWASLTGLALLSAAVGLLSEDFWSLFACLGTFGAAVLITAQHYQHRTAVLVFLGEPNRLRVLVAQCLVAALFGVVLAAASGVVVALQGETRQYWATLSAVPLTAVFGVANATVVRRPLWLLAGYAGWVLFVEGLLGKLEGPLPISGALMATSGDPRGLPILLAWTVPALAAAGWVIRRDLAGD